MLGVLVGRFGRAGLRNLARFSPRGSALAAGAGFVQIANVITQQHRLALLVLTAALLILFCWMNRRLAGMGLATSGILLNLLVMGANNGTMPISPAMVARMSSFETRPGMELTRSKDRVLDDSAARFHLLGDRLSLPGPLARLAAWSIGDMLLLAGIARLLWRIMKGYDDDKRTLAEGAAAPGTRTVDLCRGEQPGFRKPAPGRA
jgi:hypothetical protein